jgi:hypothetical protein
MFNFTIPSLMVFISVAVMLSDSLVQFPSHMIIKGYIFPKCFEIDYEQHACTEQYAVSRNQQQTEH